MHIALVTENFLPKVDGIVTRNRQVSRHLVKLGHQVTIVTPDPGLQEYAGARIYGMPSRPLPTYPARRVLLGRPGAVLDELQPDLVHIANPIVMARPAVLQDGRTHRLGILGTLAWNLLCFQLRMLHRANASGVPVLVSFHTDYFGYLKHFSLAGLVGYLIRIHRHYHQRAQVTACVSPPLIEQLGHQGMPAIAHYPSGVDTVRFHPAHADAATRRQMSGGEPDKPLLVCVGRLSKEKAVESLRVIFEAGLDVRLAIVGEGPQRAELEAAFAGTPTVFMGNLDGKALARAYASADVLLFPSPNEAFGLVLLEALASGLWVVARDRLGVPETIVDGHNGYLYDTDQELIRAVRAAIRRPARRAEARASVRHRSWGGVTEALLELYARARSAMNAP